MPFSLRFPIKEIKHWASRYAYEDDVPILRIGEEVQKRGHYTRKEFLTLARWKSARNIRHCEANAPDEVEYATRIALSPENRFERLRIGILDCLEGVDMPMASALLHFGHKDHYPILDFRALWSLGLDRRPAYYSFDLWMSYVEYCRELRKRAGTTMRTLDRALWQYSKDHQK
jgi:hypothetical protein